MGKRSTAPLQAQDEPDLQKVKGLAMKSKQNNRDCTPITSLRLQTQVKHPGCKHTRPPRSPLRHMEFFPQGRPQSMVYFHETFITFHSPRSTVIFSKARGNGNKFLNNHSREPFHVLPSPPSLSFLHKVLAFKGSSLHCLLLYQSKAQNNLSCGQGIDKNSYF